MNQTPHDRSGEVLAADLIPAILAAAGIDLSEIDAEETSLKKFLPESSRRVG